MPDFALFASPQFLESVPASHQNMLVRIYTALLPRGLQVPVNSLCQLFLTSRAGAPIFLASFYKLYACMAQPDQEKIRMLVADAANSSLDNRVFFDMMENGVKPILKVDISDVKGVRCDWDEDRPAESFLAA